MADESDDKTEAPTPKRRQEAREQGQVARSPDLTAAAVLLSVLLLLHAYGTGVISALQGLMQKLLSDESMADLSTGSIYESLLLCIRAGFMALAPILIGVAIIAIVANIIQVGITPNMARLQPNLAALNPVKGLSKMFSGKDGLVHFAMSLLKLATVSIVAYMGMRDKLPMILETQGHDFAQIFWIGAGLVYSVGVRISVTLLILALADYGYQRYSHEQSLKMSKQEVKDEMRNMDGDPKIKQRRRQIALQRIQKSIKKNVPTADVIITNPTHYSIALKYDKDAMGAPKVVAKGVDTLAFTIREIAIEHGIPILERPPLARALYRSVEVGQEIPEQFFSAVAEILAYVYELSGKMRLMPVKDAPTSERLSYVEN